MLVGNIGQPEQSGIGQLHQEQRPFLGLGGDAQLHFNFEMGSVAAPCLNIDLELDLRLGTVSFDRRRAGIFEGQVLDILANDLKTGRIAGISRAICLGFSVRCSLAHGPFSRECGQNAI